MQDNFVATFQEKRSMRVVRRTVLVALALVLGSCADEQVPTQVPTQTVELSLVLNLVAPTVRISELHYDNTGTDAGEAIEVSAPAGTDLSGWRLVLYNGSGGAAYNTVTLSSPVPATCDPRGLVVIAYAVNGIQNGSPDGIALVDAGGAVVEFLSYEGSFVAADGPALGLTATDILVSEAGTEPLGLSLQRRGDDSWSAPAAHTFGACNDDDEPPPPPPPPSLPPTRLSEIHYDNAGTDAGEAIEVEGPMGTNLAGWSIVLYNGNGGAAYGTQPLSGTIVERCSGRGVAVVNYPANGIQNGSPDGVALVDGAGVVVEFLSYEGTFVAADGPAAGLTATDIGAIETGTEPLGQSLQRDALGVWLAPRAATFGACNANDTEPPPPAPNSIAFSGRVASDPPLPVGFQDQLFATLRDGSGTTIPTTFIWSTETPAVANIDQDGVFTALSAGTATLRATAADGTTGLVSLPTRVALPGGTAQYAGNAEFGEPADADASDDVIVRRDQYTASYSQTRGTPNWVSYNLDATHFGAEDRCDCFTFDPELPGSFTRYTTADYTGAGAFHGYGIDRGHLARSFDRTTGSLDNATTFYFTNIIPQAADQNQGPWSALEIHLGDLARFQNREVYIVAGVAGSKGTVKNEGVITIPASTWKVAVALPRDQGLGNVDSPEDVAVIAVIMPNDPGVRNVPWQTYETTVDAVEALSGYDLLALLPDQIEIALESGTAAPLAATDGPYAGTDGNPVIMSGAASTDPDGDALTYAWDFGDGSTGGGVTVSHSYALEGMYPVRLTVTDTRGLTAATVTTATITAAPAAQRIERAIGLVQQLVASGRLSSPAGAALRNQLEAALRLAERDGVGLPGLLGGVVQTIDALIRSGRLREVDAAPLQDLIARVLESLT